MSGKAHETTKFEEVLKAQTDEILGNTVYDMMTSVIDAGLEYLEAELQQDIIKDLIDYLFDKQMEVQELVDMTVGEVNVADMKATDDTQIPGQMKYPDDYEISNPLGTIYSSKPIFAQPKKDGAEERKAQRAAFRAAQQAKQNTDTPS